MKNSKEIIASWIETVVTEGTNLTKFEVAFMENITDQFEHSGTLSERQEEILEQIYAARTS